MKVGLLLAAWTVVSIAARTGEAQTWKFAGAMDVTRIHGEGIFHHLESSGRRNIALSGSTVAIAWEDNRDGTPRIYLARKHIDAPSFDTAVRISGDAEAFEPSLLALGNDRYAVAWEEDGFVHVRLIDGHRIGPSIRSSEGQAAQVNLSTHGNRLYMLRSQLTDRFSHIRLRVTHLADDLSVVTDADCAVDPTTPQSDQLYPASVAAGDELIVVWEDRRSGRTILLASASRLDRPCDFEPPARVSQALPEIQSDYGKGHGVARVALGRFAASGVLAAWADKRSYWEGYDIYAATYAGNGRFSSNTKVQDEFGDFARQWHASVAANANGRVVVAWDDEREGNSDIFLSWLEGSEWSGDLPLPNASGTGHQSHPSIVMDADGSLHVAWIERAEVNGPTRLRYQLGQITQD